ncbi:MAG TPA: dynamin family protein [Chthoniobacterales bacterium]|jgi:GTPase Era involved in 16S rRNA processing
MIAERYLQLRSEVEVVLGELLKFAAELRRPTPVLDSLTGLLTNIREPLLFVVVGEVKAGKSSLINALFGQEIARADVLPATDRVCIFRYGREEKQIEVSPKLVESHLPIEFLRDVNIVDTPGTNTMVSEHQTITENFVPRADLILFVFSVVNPWTQSAWEFLKFVQKKWLKNVVFVLQQADLRDAKEIEVIRRHLQETAMQRLGVNLPVFAVSARKALLSRTSAVDKDRLWAESRFASLEEQINLIVSDAEAAMLKFRSAIQTSRVVFDEIHKELEESIEVIDRDEKRLVRINQFIDARKEQTARQIGGLLRDIEKVCRECTSEGYQLLEKKLSFWQTWKLIWGRSGWQRDFQMELEMKLRQRVQPAVEHAVQMLEVDLRGLWPQLNDTLDTLLTSDLRSQAPRTMRDFAQQRRELIQAVHLALIERVSGKSIEDHLIELFAETSTRLRVPAGVAAASGLVAVIAAMSSAAVADITGILAASAAVTGSLVVLRQRRKILHLYSGQMETKCIEISQLIEQQLKRAVEIFYQEISVAFQPLVAFCTARRREYEPQLQRAGELQKQLDTVVMHIR